MVFTPKSIFVNLRIKKITLATSYATFTSPRHGVDNQTRTGTSAHTTWCSAEVHLNYINSEKWQRGQGIEPAPSTSWVALFHAIDA